MAELHRVYLTGYESPHRRATAGGAKYYVRGPGRDADGWTGTGSSWEERLIVPLGGTVDFRDVYYGDTVLHHCLRYRVDPGGLTVMLQAGGVPAEDCPICKGSEIEDY